MQARSGNIFPLDVHSSLLPFPFHLPHRLRYSLTMMIMVMMMMKEIFLFFRALSLADLIFLFGARLNWILHFGKTPRFKTDVKIVQVLYRHSVEPPAIPSINFKFFSIIPRHFLHFFFLQNAFLVKKDK